MTGYIGQALLGGAFVMALTQVVLPAKYQKGALFSLLGQAVLIWGAFSLLIWAHISSDFTLLNVFLHSHTSKPFLYKISGVWGNHEGSMLLWVVLLTTYFYAFSKRLKNYGFLKPSIILTIFGLISAGFIGFILLACDPFNVMAEPVSEGQDLNPLLQDPSLAIHPPALYLGYVGFVIPFVIAVTILLQRRQAIEWVIACRSWTLFAWTFLTLGLGLGSFWAYYELGWGGWWFWDPVENAALMPWLSATALLHTLIVAQKRHALIAWSLFLCIFTFALCLLGTFLVRSGFLTSVHSFAVDSERGFLILLLSGFLILPAVYLFFSRLKTFISPIQTDPLSRTGMILLNTLFLMSGVVTVGLGTLYPLILSYFGRNITVGEPFFNLTFLPMMSPIMVLMGIAPWLTWQPSDLRKIAPDLLSAFVLAVGVVLLAFSRFNVRSALALLYMGAGVWSIFLTGKYLCKTLTIPSARRSFGLYGMVLAHLGIGIAILGMVGSTIGSQEYLHAVKIGDKFTFASRDFYVSKKEEIKGNNYTATRLIIEISPHKVLSPEKRYYWTQHMIHGETSLSSTFFSHYYASLGDEYEGGKWSLHLYYKPLINLLWFGGGLIVLGGLVTFVGWVRRGYVVTILVCLLPVSGYAMSVHEVLGNQEQEIRARHLSHLFLCPTCAGQTLDDSVSEEAEMLRAEIRQGILAGLTDQQIIDDFVLRFGEKILKNPSQDKETLLLWFGPWVILGGMLGGAFWFWQRRKIL